MMIAVSVLVSWVGFTVHNFAGLPGTSLVDPNTPGPTVVWLMLLVVWLARPSRLSAGLLLGWIALNLVGGGILSVPPLPIWPFTPAQTVHHYVFHGIYTITQIPAVILLVREIARRRATATASHDDANSRHKVHCLELAAGKDQATKDLGLQDPDR